MQATHFFESRSIWGNKFFGCDQATVLQVSWFIFIIVTQYFYQRQPKVLVKFTLLYLSWTVSYLDVPNVLFLWLVRDYSYVKRSIHLIYFIYVHIKRFHLQIQDKTSLRKLSFYLSNFTEGNNIKASGRDVYCASHSGISQRYDYFRFGNENISTFQRDANIPHITVSVNTTHFKIQRKKNESHDSQPTRKISS